MSIKAKYISYGKYETGGYKHELFFAEQLAQFLTTKYEKCDLKIERPNRFFENPFAYLKLFLLGLKANANYNVVVARVAVFAVIRNLFTKNKVYIVLHNFDEDDGKSIWLNWYYHLFFLLLKNIPNKNVSIVAVAPFWVNYFKNKINNNIQVQLFPNFFDTNFYKTIYQKAASLNFQSPQESKKSFEINKSSFEIGKPAFEEDLLVFETDLSAFEEDKPAFEESKPALEANLLAFKENKPVFKVGKTPLKTTKKQIHLGQWSFKNHPDVFEVAKQLTEKGYYCYFSTNFKDFAKKTNHYEVVYFEQFEDYLIQMAISEFTLALTAINEGWNRVAHESILVGTPVIAYAKAGLLDLVNESKSYAAVSVVDVLQAIENKNIQAEPSLLSQYDIRNSQEYIRHFFS